MRSGDHFLAGDADLDLLSRRFNITGGNIKNIALAAAFLAAGDGRVIDMRHLALAARREYQKIGKLVVEAEFNSLVHTASDGNGVAS